MFRSSVRLAATSLAALSMLAGMAAADHDRTRGNGAIRLQLGAGQYARGMPRLWIELGNRGRRGGLVARGNAPFVQPYDPYVSGEDGDFAEPDTAAWHLDRPPPGDRARARQLDADLGRELEALRRDLARRGELSAPPPAPELSRPAREPEIEVTRLPEQPALGAVNAAPVIEEEAVLGPIDLLTAPAPGPATPAGAVATIGAADVERHGPQAFDLIADPRAAGLPRLDGGRNYYRLNGDVVIADADAERALIVAALNQVLAQ